MATILIVEDQILLLRLMELSLREEGFEVLSATAAQEALAILESDRSIDLLFTDIILPGGIDGWQLGEHARNVRADLPIFYTTGYSVREPPKIDAACFFMKPYSIDVVVKAAKRITANAD